MAWLSNAVQKRPRQPWLEAVGLGLTAAVAGGFDELIGAALFLAGPLALLTTWTLSPLQNRRRILTPITAVILGAGIGTAANVFGPGSLNRASAQGAHVSLSAALHTAVMNLSYLRADAHAGVLLLSLAAGMLVWQLVGPIGDPVNRQWLAAWAGFLLIVPWIVTAALTAWGGSTESGGHSPFRAAFLPLGFVALALILIVWVLLSWRATPMSAPVTTLVTLVLAAGGTVALAHKAMPIIRAESMRAQAVSKRTSSIRRQLAAGAKPIRVVPAPLLTVFTQAYDLSFAPADQQRSGWVSAFARGHGIPQGETVSVTTKQPRDYCLAGVTASWVGVQSCQQLIAPTRRG